MLVYAWDAESLENRLTIANLRHLREEKQHGKGKRIGMHVLPL